MGIQWGAFPNMGSYCTNLLKKLERAKGFEPSTPTLARLCSTPELRPLWRPEEVSSRRVGGN